MAVQQSREDLLQSEVCFVLHWAIYAMSKKSLVPLGFGLFFFVYFFGVFWFWFFCFVCLVFFSNKKKEVLVLSSGALHNVGPTEQRRRRSAVSTKFQCQ